VEIPYSIPHSFFLYVEWNGIRVHFLSSGTQLKEAGTADSLDKGFEPGAVEYIVGSALANFGQSHELLDQFTLRKLFVISQDLKNFLSIIETFFVMGLKGAWMIPSFPIKIIDQRPLAGTAAVTAARAELAIVIFATGDNDPVIED
jgi:hypothetical protein